MVVKAGRLIHDQAIFRPLGDRYLTLEFGEEPTVACNVRVVAMREALNSVHLRGVVGYVMVPRALSVIYDPLQIEYADLCRALREVEQEARGVEVVRSRLFDIPTWYDDPWTRECAQAQKGPYNLEFVAQANGMTTRQVVDLVSTTQYWVAAVFFYVGAYNAFPIDPRVVLSAPKWVVPRTWTPDRTVAFAGTYIGSYALPGPGGYQMLGRTAVDLYEQDLKNSIFRETGEPILCRYSDRHVYRSIGEEEYEEIRRQIENGTYNYSVKYESFNIKRYSEAIERGEQIRPEDYIEQRW
jgi:urea carboxylase